MSSPALFSSWPAVTYSRSKCFNLLDYAKVNRENGAFNNFTIHVGHFSIGANRMVLSCYSTFFENLFKSEMKKECQLSIHIEHLEDATAVKLLIDYMYEGNITINCANVESILAAAHFLQLAEVKLFCFNFLEKHISPDNWYAVLSAAKSYKSDRLQNYSYQFMMDHWLEIIQTNDFKNMAKDDLTLFVSKLKESKVDMSETILCKLVIGWTKQDEERRKAMLADLFQMIDLQKLPYEVLQNLFKEELINNNNVCESTVMCELFYRLELQESRNNEL